MPNRPSGPADELVTGLVDGGPDGLLVERRRGGDGHLAALGGRRDRGHSVQGGYLLRDRLLAVAAGHAEDLVDGGDALHVGRGARAAGAVGGAAGAGVRR